MRALLGASQVNEVYQLIPAPTGPKSSDAYVGTLDVHVSADAALEVFCRGGRVLKVCTESCLL